MDGMEWRFFHSRGPLFSLLFPTTTNITVCFLLAYMLAIVDDEGEEVEEIGTEMP